MDEALFFAFTALAVLSALLAVTRKNAVAAACWLVVMFFGLAGVFVLEEAFFVATTQILVYAGAIMVLFLFVIMLLDLRSVELAAHQGPKLKVAGVVLAGLFLAAVLHAITDAKTSPRIADRVAASVRRPTTASPTSEAVTLVGEPPAAPIVREEIGEEPPGITGDRSFGGTFRLDPASAVASNRLKITVEPKGAVDVRVDGKPLPAAPWDGDPTAHERRATFLLPGAPEGTKLDVHVVRGGLDAAPGGGPDGSPRAIGMSLFEVWLLPFEVASILLTGAIFGAVVLTKRRLS